MQSLKITTFRFLIVLQTSKPHLRVRKYSFNLVMENVCRYNIDLMEVHLTNVWGPTHIIIMQHLITKNLLHDLLKYNVIFLNNQ